MPILEVLIRFLLGLIATFAVLLVAIYVLLRQFDRLPGHVSLLEFTTSVVDTVWARLLEPFLHSVGLF